MIPKKKYLLVKTLEPNTKSVLVGDWWKWSPLRALLQGEDGEFYIGTYSISGKIKNRSETESDNIKIYCSVIGPILKEEAIDLAGEEFIHNFNLLKHSEYDSENSIIGKPGLDHSGWWSECEEKSL